VPGRHGSYDFSDNTFEKRIIEIELRYIGTNFAELRTRARQIAYWLSGFSGTKNLIFSDEPDKQYIAKIYSEIGLANLFKVGECKVQFECEPFAYYLASTGEQQTWSSILTWDNDYLAWFGSFSGYTLDVTANVTATFTNYGTFNVRPTFRITGSFTDFTITQGTATLTYTEAITGSQTLTIDCENYTVALGTTNKMTEISGTATAEFIELATGSNTLIFSGTSMNASVTVDFTARYL
jgi:predicted phage tail component-like protein